MSKIVIAQLYLRAPQCRRNLPQWQERRGNRPTVVPRILLLQWQARREDRPTIVPRKCQGLYRTGRTEEKANGQHQSFMCGRIKPPLDISNIVSAVVKAMPQFKDASPAPTRSSRHSLRNANQLSQASQQGTSSLPTSNSKDSTNKEGNENEDLVSYGILRGSVIFACVFI